MIVAVPYSSGINLTYDVIEGIDEWGETYAISNKQTAIRTEVQYDVYLDEWDATDIALALALGFPVFTTEDAYRRWVNGEEPLEGDLLTEPPPLTL